MRIVLAGYPLINVQDPIARASVLKIKKLLGWREWVGLPALGIPRIKAKVDTGARTSALHTFRVESLQREGGCWVRFWVHPLQKDVSQVVICEAPVMDQRIVRDSGGHEERRFVILTDVQVGDTRWPIEVTLTDRDTMGFRMLLGRTAIRHGYLVDAGRSFLVPAVTDTDQES